MQTAPDHYTKRTLEKYCDLLAARDKRVGGVIESFGYPRFRHREPGFESLVIIILEQQVSLTSAFAVFQKLKDRLGEITPERVLAMGDDDFKQCGFSRQKKTYVSGLAGEIASGQLDLDKLNLEDADSIRKRLVAIKGIGNWTVDIYLLSCLHKLDIFPLGDLALVKAMRERALIKPDDTRDAMVSRVEKFRPFRSILTIIMWHHYIQANNLILPFDR